MASLAKLSLGLSACALLMAACSDGNGSGGRATLAAAEDGESRQFFENARRREAAGIEKDVVVNVGGCAAFYVENDRGITTIASARHCFEFNATEWCKTGTFNTNDGQSGTCVRVVAGDARHDIVVFEAKMPFTPRREQTLRLASFSPAVDTKLKMIGYPGDPDRRGKLTVTDNCWVLSSDTTSPYGDPNLSDRAALHNCSTYGGNSGGPMLIDGTRIAVGLPFTYVPDDFNDRPATSLAQAAHLAKSADLVGVYSKEMREAGIVIAKAADDDAGGQSALNVDADLFAALRDKGETVELFIGGKAGSNAVIVCPGRIAACSLTVPGAAFAPLLKTVGERRIYAVSGTVEAPDGRELTAVALDNSGNVISRIAFQISGS